MTGVAASVPADAGIFTWLVLPLLIFVARATDMTLSTLRIVFIAQGRTALAPVIGFVEALIWILLMGQVLRHMSNPLCVIGYAAGFATGNALGLRLEERLAFGRRILRIILQQDAGPLVEALRAAGFGVTVVDGEGMQGPVKILFTLVERRHLEQAIEMVRSVNEKAFFTVEDVRQAVQGAFPARGSTRARRWLPWRVWREIR